MSDHHHIVVINHYEDENKERLDFVGSEHKVKTDLLYHYHWLYRYGGMAADLSTLLHALNDTQVYSVYEKVGDEYDEFDEPEAE